MSFLGNVARDGVVIVPSNTVPLADIIGAVYVGGAGDVAVETAGGTTLTFSAFPAGQILPVRVSKVLTASTATLMLGLIA